MTESWAKVIDHLDNKTVLGLVGMPALVAEMIERRGEHRVMGRAEMATAQYWAAPMAMNDADLTIRSFMLQKARYRSADGVFILGIELEALSAEPGFMFLPSAEYIRRSMQPKGDPVAMGSSFQVGTPKDRSARVWEEIGP